MGYHSKNNTISVLIPAQRVIAYCERIPNN